MVDAVQGDHGPWPRLRSQYLEHPEDGSLPALLITLSFSTGLIDATSMLGLGRVFVGNMTGNVVFLGLAIGRAPGFSTALTSVALLGFVVGAFASGAAGRRHAFDRGRALRATCATQLVLVGTALVLVAPDPRHLARSTEMVVIACVAVAMGLQNATTRTLGVAGLATNVLTTTLTAVAADGGRPSGADASRRLASVMSLFLGACLGAVLVVHFDILPSLALVLVLLLAVIAACHVAILRGRSWVARRP